MGRNEIITSKLGRELVPLHWHEFPDDAGEFVGTLIYRAWHPKKRCLVCYFNTDNEICYKLFAWFNTDYAPRKTKINFADDVANGTRWKCTFVKSKGGSITWMTAEKL